MERSAPSGTARAFNRPIDWQAFERLTRDLFARLLGDGHTDLNGSSGQPQAGVDVWGTDQRTGASVGIQCKGRNDAHFDRHAAVTEREFRAEVQNALSFTPRLNRFVFLTTGPNDERLKRIAREISEQHAKEGLFDVKFHGWDWIEGKLASNLDLAIGYDLTAVVLMPAPAIGASTIAKSIGARLQQAIRLMNEGRPADKPVSIQSLARPLGHSSWRRLEQIAEGSSEADISELTALASGLGLNAAWLIEGREEPFWLDAEGRHAPFMTLYDQIRALKPERVYFVRRCDNGFDALITVKLDALRYRTFTMLYPLRSQVGAGGAAQIFEFCCLVRKLSAHGADWPIPCSGRHIDGEGFNALLSGRAYAGALLQHFHDDLWWDAFAALALDRARGEGTYWRELGSAMVTALHILGEYRQSAPRVDWRRDILNWAGFERD